MLEAYGEERGMPMELTGPMRLRHRLYAIYLHLIIATEAVIRGYEELDLGKLLGRVLPALEADLARL
jgi:hypothetical protein